MKFKWVGLRTLQVAFTHVMKSWLTMMVCEKSRGGGAEDMEREKGNDEDNLEIVMARSLLACHCALMKRRRQENRGRFS
jgi:hypothetical protein